MAGRAMRALKDRFQARLEELVKLGAVGKSTETRSVAVASTRRYPLGRYWEEYSEYRPTAAQWGDYDNSGTHNRSNARRLAEEYPFCADDGGGMGGGLRFTDAWLNDSPESLGRIDEFLDTIESLYTDYPVYDEDDDSALRDEIVDEAWGRWLGADVRNEIRGIAYGLVRRLWRTDQADAWEEAFDAELDRVEGLPVEDSDSLRSMFWEVVDMVNSGEVRLPGVVPDIMPEFEGSDSFYLPGMIDVCRYLAEMLVAATDPRNEELAPDVDGQQALI